MRACGPIFGMEVPRLHTHSYLLGCLSLSREMFQKVHHMYKALSGDEYHLGFLG